MARIRSSQMIEAMLEESESPKVTIVMEYDEEKKSKLKSILRRESKYRKEDIPGDARWKTFGLTRSQVVRNFKEEERKKASDEKRGTKNDAQLLDVPNDELKVGQTTVNNRVSFRDERGLALS